MEEESTVLTSKEYGRTTTSWKLAGTKTFRLGSKKLLGKYGGNLQNWEKGMRELLEADPGKEFVQTDQAGAEALIVAYLMPPTNKLRQLFLNGIKIHNYLSVMFPEQWEKDYPQVHAFKHVPIDKLKEFQGWREFEKVVAASDNNPPETRYYYHYKQTGHSSNYNIKGPTFVNNLLLKSGGAVRLTVKQGEHYLNGYHTLLPELKGHFHVYVAHCYKTYGVLYNFQGYPITLTTKYDEGEFSKIYDKIPQSTVGTITNNAYCDAQEFVEREGLDWDIMLNGHDSLVGQAPVSETREMGKMMKKWLSPELVNPWGEKFAMKAEVQIGKNLAPRKVNKDGSVCNPEGLIEIKDL